MKKRLVALARNKRGAVFFMMAFSMLFLFIFVLATLEITKIFSISFSVETQVRRLVNNAVENNIDDAYRADGFNYLNVAPAIAEARASFLDYTGTKNVAESIVPSGAMLTATKLAPENGRLLYSISIDNIVGERETATLMCKGTLYIAPLIGGLEDDFLFQIPISIRSTNFRTDEGATGTGINGSIGQIIDSILGGNTGDEVGDLVNGGTAGTGGFIGSGGSHNQDAFLGGGTGDGAGILPGSGTGSNHGFAGSCSHPNNDGFSGGSSGNTGGFVSGGK